MTIKKKIILTFFYLLYFLNTTYASSITASKVSHGFSTFGQLKYPANFQHFSYVNPQAPKKGSINLAGLGTFDTLNPFIIKGTPPNSGLFSILKCYATLLENSGDEPASAYGYVAESLQVAPDYSWVIFNLNSKAKFNNGEFITADDVTFSFNILKEKGSPLFRTYYQAVTQVEKLSDLQVKFHLKNNKSKELPYILGHLPILSQKYYDTHKFDETTLIPPPFSGPYEISQINAGRSITFTRVKNWWGENIPSQKGTDNFEEIKIDFYRDINAMFEAFKSGQIDIRFENRAKEWVTGYDFPAVKNGFVKKELVKHSISGGSYGLYFNIRKPIFSHTKVRQALSLMFNFNWLNKNLFYGQYKRSQSYFPNSGFEANKLPEGKEKEFLTSLKKDLPSDIFTKMPDFPDHKTEKDIRACRDKALVLLKEAGWEIKNQKLIHLKTKNLFSFEFLIFDQTMEKIALHFQGYLKHLGIDMKVRLVDIATYQERLDHHNFDMVVHIIPQGPCPGNEQMSFWGSKTANVVGTKNIIGIQNKAIDNIIEKLINVNDYETLTIRTRALDRVLLAGYYMIPAWYRDENLIAYWNRFSKPQEGAPYQPIDISSWWIDEEKDKTLPAELQRSQSKVSMDSPVPQDNTLSWWQSLINWFKSFFVKV